MHLKEVKSACVGEKYYETKLKNGLHVYVYPKPGYMSKYVVFGTNYGSINTSFKSSNNEDAVNIPDGTAHFLEHKLFESEDGDAFEKYARTGASANAYTSFDKTCYLFSCTDNFYDSLKILLDLVTKPYFTEQTVKKEQGIIGQEIKMYEDDPNWMVLFNLLNAMYKNHSVKINIAGTVQSISEITAEKLYECYNAFYNLNNMSICIVGDVDPQEVVSFINSNLKHQEPVEVSSIFSEEPYSIVQESVCKEMEVSAPLFEIGFKEKVGSTRADSNKIANTLVLLELLSSKTSDMYQKLLAGDLINASFSSEYFEGDSFACTIFSGESNNPDEVLTIIKEEISSLKKNGIDKDVFEMAKKAVYGRAVMSLDDCSDIANELMDDALCGRDFFSYIESVSSVTVKSVKDKLLNDFDVNNVSISKIVPIDQIKEK